MSSAADRVIKQIDEALGRYYALQKQKGYFDDEKVGKFRTYCMDNGLDDDETIEEEFDQGDPAESLLVDFDDDFPGIDKDDPQRNLLILKILKNCRENETAYLDSSGEKYASFTVTRDNWLMTDKDEQKTLEIYKEQCPVIFDRKFQEDGSILKVLTVGLRIDKPYLSYLCDTFQRERVEHLNAEIRFTIPLWQHTNRHLKELKNINIRKSVMDKSSYDFMISAIHSYFKRVSPQVMWYPPIFIKDSIRQTCEYLTSAVDFVYELTNEQYTSCPFQFDLVLAYNKVSKSGNQIMPGFYHGDDDVPAEEMYHFADDDEDEPEVKKRDPSEEFYDCFGAIKQRLADARCLHTVKEIDEKESVGTTTKKRVLKQSFEDFKSEKIKRKYGGASEDFKQYPRKHRFCALVDRRKPGGENKGKKISGNDEVIMYEPPEDCNSFKSNKVLALAYMNHSRTCIVPKLGYNKKGGRMNYNQSDKEKEQSETITALSTCKGGMILFSFHVESVDEMRLYLFVNGHCIRFLPEDIVKILPMFFDPDFEDNDPFIVSDRARTLIREMNSKLRDTQFKAFLNRNRSTKEDIQESRDRYNKFILM